MPKLFNDATNKQGLIVYGGEASSDFGSSQIRTFQTLQRPLFVTW